MVNKLIIIINLLITVFISSQVGLNSQENYQYEEKCLTEDCSKKIQNVSYFDGLGRVKQTIAIAATPQGNDLIVPFEYDSYGRQIKEYLPLPQPVGLQGAYAVNPFYYGNLAYGNDKTYSEKNYESSPLDRIIEQKSVGNDWSTHPISFNYSVNTDDSNQEQTIKYFVSTSWQDGITNNDLSISGNYPTGSLYKSTITDEDGKLSVEYKNLKGQTVLVRKKFGGQNIDLYSVYDKYGNLAYTIPPLAAKSGLVDHNTLDNLCYQYKYDKRGRMVGKKLPGKGWEFLVYDKADRVILSQDANLRKQDKWLITKYEKFGRVAYTGIIIAGDRVSLQNSLNSMVVSEVRDSGGFTKNGMTIFYTNSILNSLETVLSVNYYDTYPQYSFNPIITSVLGKIPISDNFTTNNISTKGLPVANLIKNIEDDNWTKNFTYYDSKGRVICTYSINHLGGYTKTEYELGFTGNIIKNIVSHKRILNVNEKIISQNFEYDNQNRLKRLYHQVDNLPQELIVENFYNEFTQLWKKNVGGTLSAPLQSVEYKYNIKGWMTKINDPENLSGKLFAYEIKYNNPNIPSTAPPQYAGNISEVHWRTAKDDIYKSYHYEYDDLGRLKYSIYREPFTTTPNNHFFNEEVEYDINGNINHLLRTGKSTQNTAALIDNLTYNMIGNQLVSINDVSSNYEGYPEASGNTISYDDNGNMSDHVDKGILQLGYNFLNLVNYIKFDNTYTPRFPIGDISAYVNTRYTYRADGTKLKKFYTYGLGRNRVETYKITEYIDGFQYEVTTSNELDPQVLKFVPTSEGYYDFENNKYIYTYKDHLGNIRLSYFNNGSGAQILEENNYYAFGLKHNAGLGLQGNTAYKYQYNGKEIQEETGMNDYGWRQYMPELGRWNGIDQLAENYNSTSPYAYVVNNPILGVDVDGRWMDDDGHIDTSGIADPFKVMGISRRAFFSQWMGRTSDEGGGGGNPTLTIGDILDELGGSEINSETSAVVGQTLPNPFSKGEINFLVSAGVMSAATAKLLMGTLVTEGVAGTIGLGLGAEATGTTIAGGIANTAAAIIARTFAIGLLFSVKGDSSPPRAYVYVIMGQNDIAKFGVTRAMDPDSRPERQLSGLNKDFINQGPHSWKYLHQGVTSNEAFIYEKYYVWQYYQNRRKMPYAQMYPKPDALTRSLIRLLKNK